VRTFDALPANARAYVQAIEQHSGLSVRTVSVGPERQQVILR
jgi:adenylosuccinate synthase